MDFAQSLQFPDLYDTIRDAPALDAVFLGLRRLGDVVHPLLDVDVTG